MSDKLKKQLEKMQDSYRLYREEAERDGTFTAEEKQLLNKVATKLEELRKKIAARESGKDPLDLVVDEAIGDPKKRLEALAKYKVPRYSEEFEDDDKEPLLAFLKEMQSGTEKANEYIKYTQQMAERAEKFGDIAGLNDVSRAAGGLKKISSKIGGGLKKWGGRIDKAKQAARWFIELDKFADASSAMDPRNRKSVEAWVGQMKRLWDATAPFAEWANGKLVTAAFAGSRVAVVASATMSAVGAQIFIGLKVLDLGVKNVGSYLDRYDKIMKQIDSGRTSGPKVPPPPPYPGDWKTREEQKEAALAAEERGLRQAVQDVKDAKARKKAEAARAAAARFDAEIFPQLYLKNRDKIAKALLSGLRKAGKKTAVITDLKADNRSSESRWWDCLFKDDADEGRMDPQAGMWVHRHKARVSAKEAEREIENFLAVKPPCPPFGALRDPALSRYVKSKVDL